LKLTLGYRDSEETSGRKERIDKKLKREIEEKINQFTESDECRKDGGKRLAKFQDLGYEGYVTENITTDILEKATSLIGRTSN
jgi:hypothetical protein